MSENKGIKGINVKNRIETLKRKAACMLSAFEDADNNEAREYYRSEVEWCMAELSNLITYGTPFIAA